MPYIAPPVPFDPFDVPYQGISCAEEKDWLAKMLLVAERLKLKIDLEFEATIKVYQHKHFLWLGNSAWHTATQVKIAVKLADLMAHRDRLVSQFGALHQLLLAAINAIDCNDPNWRVQADAAHQYLRELTALVYEYLKIVGLYKHWIETDQYSR